jgi:hypothetical protein
MCCAVSQSTNIVEKVGRVSPLRAVGAMPKTEEMVTMPDRGSLARQRGETSANKFRPLNL